MDKTVKRIHDKDKYLIFVELDNGEIRTFENTDAIFKLKFNSADYYAEMKIGHKYKFNTIGFRIPMLSIYENITDFEEVK